MERGRAGAVWGPGGSRLRFVPMHLVPMHLVQILLPLFDNDGHHQPDVQFRRVRGELVDRFGGLTAFTRAPAEGLWEQDGATARDDIIVLEVMVDAVDAPWWRDYRRELERRFRQDAIVVRAQEVRLL